MGETWARSKSKPTKSLMMLVGAVGIDTAGAFPNVAAEFFAVD
jgi:hypothetical protein